MTKNEFPLASLPSSIRGAVEQCCRETQAPSALVAASALAACSLACQSHVMVLRPGAHRPSPTSQFFFNVAKSGERKTTVDGIFFQGAHSFLDVHTERIANEKQVYVEQLKIWTIQDRALSRKLASATTRGEDTKGIEAQLSAHSRLRPARPIEPNLFFTDATPAAIKYELSETWKSACLHSSEGAAILSSRVSSELSTLDVLWDGGDLPVHRKESESYILKGARLTLALMAQPGVVRSFLSRGGEHARDIGFLSRCLISFPQSTQGTRLLDGSRFPQPHVKNFNGRLTEIHLEYFNKKGELASTPTVLRLGHEASAMWRAKFNDIEKEIGPGGQFEEIADFASKFSENVLRMAAVFHHVEKIPSEEIQPNEMKAACEVMNFYLMEALRLFGPAGEISKSYANASELEQWFVDKRTIYGKHDIFQKNTIRNHGPNCIRDKKDLDDALQRLVTEGKIEVNISGRTAIVRGFYKDVQDSTYPPRSYPPTSIDFMGLRYPSAL